MVEDAESELEAEGRKRARSCREQTKGKEEPQEVVLGLPVEGEPLKRCYGWGGGLGSA